MKNTQAEATGKNTNGSRIILNGILNYDESRVSSVRMDNHASSAVALLLTLRGMAAYSASVNQTVKEVSITELSPRWRW